MRPVSADAAAQPNIIVILSDDGGYNEYGFNAAISGPNGTPTPNQAYTPNLDALAAQSVIGRQAYAQPICGESRAALLTGITNNRLGLEESLNNSAPLNVPLGFVPGQPTIASRLKTLGYSTGMVGKWHVGYTPGVNTPTDLGFDEFFGFLGGQRSYFAPANSFTETMFRGKTNVEAIWPTQGDASKYEPVKGRYVTDAFGEESVDFINNHAHDGKPFFLYSAFNSPHGPNDYKTSDYNEPHIAQVNDPNYPSKRATEAMLYAMDREVGDMMTALVANGIDNNTIVVFLNDNGGVGNVIGGVNYGDDNAPLNSFKGLTFEGGIRVPFLIRAPGLQHSVYDSPILEQDLLPTFVNAAGGDASQFATDGVDLIPYLSGANTNAAHPEAFWRNRGAWAVRKGDWKLSRPGGTNVFGFYNIATDQSERFNLIGVNDTATKLKRGELARDFNGWEATLVKPKFGISGADNRNKFDHFVFRNDLATTANWSATNGWQEFGNTSHNVTMQVDDAYANDVVEFTTRDDASYTANNDMTRMSGLSYMLNQVQFTGNFGGGVERSGTVSGRELMFVKNLNGQAPRIQLDATATGAASFTFNLNTELDLYDDLTIAGDGTQNFVIGGQIVDFYVSADPTNTSPHNVTKTGTSNVTLTANNTFKGIFTINGGQVHVSGASAAISAASKITIGVAGALVLDSGSISVPIIENSRQGSGSTVQVLPGDYNGDHQVNAADFSIWRHTFGQTGTGLAADGNGDNIVNEADFDLWSANFGNTDGGGGTTGGTPGGALVINGGTLKVPTITGDVTNSGGILAFGAAPAVRTIGGSLAENLGVLQVLIGGIVPGTNMDQIQVGGSTSLGGTLMVQLLYGFAPSLGQSFQFLTSIGSVSGTFASLSLPSLSGGKAWQLLYGSNDLTLMVVAAGSAASIISGDYNHDGVVDAADFAVWHRSLGSTTNLAADGNGNGVIDQGDYTIWVQHFGVALAGSGSESGSMATYLSTIPEPSTITSLILGSVPLKLVRGSRARQKAGSLDCLANSSFGVDRSGFSWEAAAKRKLFGMRVGLSRFGAIPSMMKGVLLGRVSLKSALECITRTRADRRFAATLSPLA